MVGALAKRLWCLETRELDELCYRSLLDDSGRRVLGPVVLATILRRCA